MESKFCAFYQYDKDLDGQILPLVKALGITEELEEAKELCWLHREKNAAGSHSYYIAEYQDFDWTSTNGSTLNKINTHFL